ncbi:UvrD-helicase domain-containing protein [Paraburkholderia phenoliruptrix]|uniref:UvrD-helicase domain-containing protein n=1 Tax=Paraburkholderia phenoliruptrix TaxID=252970 RepID=UPI0039B3FC32
MTARFSLTEDDLLKIGQLFPRLSFTRKEQIDAILDGGTADFQAAPGSGKTTLLGAKLSLMAARWPFAHRGICILTHTNVAREEIERCLNSVPYGNALLAYPHFIGTIQSFVNKFLALPWLRELGIDVRETDEDAFAEQFFRRVNANRSARIWISQSPQQRTRAVKGVRYRGADLQLVTHDDLTLPATGTTIAHLQLVKNAMAREGRLRHEDMFAYAEQAISKVPGLVDAVEYRFPNVFIDEMQDTSDVQLNALYKVFRNDAVIQRFGDVNQAILNRTRGTLPNAFPVANCSEVRTSLRFGSTIAAVVNAVKPVGAEIVGEGPAALAPPTLILYSEATIQDVISRFGTWAATLLPADEISQYPIKAICAIKAKGNPAQKVGRHISDYFPAFDDALTPRPTNRTIRQLLRAAASTSGGNRVGAARSALLQIVQEYGATAYKEARTWRQLVQIASANDVDMETLKQLVLEIVVDPSDLTTDVSARDTIATLISKLGELIEAVTTAEDIPDEWLVDTGSANTQMDGVNSLTISAGAMRFPLHVATIASVKGETHLATLVLESCRNRKFDLANILPYFCGSETPANETHEEKLRSLMNIFVAASRPRRLLAFAMHADRATASSRASLIAKGWDVKDWTS